MRFKAVRRLFQSLQFGNSKAMGSSQRLSDYLHQRYLEQLAGYQAIESLDFTFDQPLAGNGWHNRESNGCTYWRFTGPTRQATLFFPRIVPAQARLRISVFHAVTPEHVERLMLVYNGIDLILLEREGNVLVYAIPADAITACGYTGLQIHTLPTECPPDDSRLLGIAVQRIEIY